jgi:hypothetical protein
MATSLVIGLTLVVVTVHLHDIRHLSVPVASSVLVDMAVVGLAASPLIGTLTDRFRPWPILLVCTLAGAETLSCLVRERSEGNRHGLLNAITRFSCAC